MTASVLPAVVGLAAVWLPWYNIRFRLHGRWGRPAGSGLLFYGVADWRAVVLLTIGMSVLASGGYALSGRRLFLLASFGAMVASIALVAVAIYENPLHQIAPGFQVMIGVGAWTTLFSTVVAAILCATAILWPAHRES